MNLTISLISKGQWSRNREEASKAAPEANFFTMGSESVASVN